MAKDEDEEEEKGDAQGERVASAPNVESGRRREAVELAGYRKGVQRGGRRVQKLPRRTKEGERARARERKRKRPRRLSVLSLTVTAASPEFYPCLIRSSLFFSLLLLLREREERADTPLESARKRESDAEDDAGAAKLDTSPAVLSPSFILRTFYRLPR